MPPYIPVKYHVFSIPIFMGMWYKLSARGRYPPERLASSSRAGLSGTRPNVPNGSSVRAGSTTLFTMFTVYVLRDQNGKMYKGMTNDIQRRLYEHDLGKTRTTSRMGSLQLVYYEKFDTFVEARKRELYFKTAAGRRFLKAKLGPLAQR